MKPLLSPSGEPVRDEAGLLVYEETPFYTPPGQAKGLLSIENSIDEKAQKPGGVCGFFSDLARARQFDIIPVQDWGYWIEAGAGDQKRYVWDILSQRNVGSCAAEDVAQNIMVRGEAGGQKRVKLNPYGMYWHTSGGRDSGSSHPDNLAYAREHGCPSQEVRPRSKSWRASPTEEEREDAKRRRIKDFYQVRSTAELGTGVLMGFTAVVGYPGHSICGVKVLNTLQIEYANSWDESWGDRGFGVLRFSSIHWGYGVYLVEGVTDWGS